MRPKGEVLPFNALCTLFADTMSRRWQYPAIRLPCIGMVVLDVVLSVQLLAERFTRSIGTTTVVIRQDALLLGIPGIPCPTRFCFRADKRPKLVEFCGLDCWFRYRCWFLWNLLCRSFDCRHDAITMNAKNIFNITNTAIAHSHWYNQCPNLRFPCSVAIGHLKTTPATFAAIPLAIGFTFSVAFDVVAATVRAADKVSFCTSHVRNYGVFLISLMFFLCVRIQTAP